jgi:hypothetical protein
VIISNRFGNRFGAGGIGWTAMIKNPTKVFGQQTEREEGHIIAGAHVVWCGRGVHDFRPDARDAVRFSRECDAQMVLHWMLPEEYARVCHTEHHEWVPEEEEEAKT